VSSAVEFAQNIGSQTQECRSQVDVRVSDTSILSIGCVDPKTSFGTWNVPGGMLLLWWENEEAFEDFSDIVPECPEHFMSTCVAAIYSVS